MLAFLTSSPETDTSTSEPLRLFVHIPKTAGTTVRVVLSMNEPGPRSRAIGNVFKGGGGISRSVARRMRTGQPPDLEKVRLLRGHAPLGVREYIRSVLPEERELQCFTFLREPVDRTLSHFFAIRSVGRAYGLPPLAPDATLADALAGGYMHDNLQTRMLSGLPEPFGEVDDDMLEQAKRNLREGLVFFGLTERFEESLVLARLRLGLRSVFHSSNSRVNTTRPRGKEVPAELRQAAERYNRYDMQLYRDAVELFDSAPEHEQIEFQVEAAALRAARGDGRIDPDMPPPAGLEGQKAWRMLVDTRTQLLVAEFNLRRRPPPRAPETLEQAIEEDELKAARARARKLQKQVEGLRAAVRGSRRLKQEVERLREEAARTEDLQRALEQTIERLEAARSRRDRLERKVKRLQVGVPTEPPERRHRKPRRGL